METSLPLFPDPLQEPLLLGELHLEKDAIDIAPPYTLGAGRDVGGAKAVGWLYLVIAGYRWL